MANISKDQIKQILSNAPPEVDKAKLLKSIGEQGHIIEGYNDSNPQTSMGQNIANYARPALETAGSLGGAALATGMALPTGPGALLAGTAGGALGFAGGKAMADLLDRTIGDRPQISSQKQMVSEIGSDLYSGAEAEAMGLGTGAAWKALKAVGKGVMSATLGPTVEAISARFANNPLIKNAKQFDVLATELPDDIQKMSEKVGKKSTEALDTLSTSKYLVDGATAKTQILKAIEKEQIALGRPISDAGQQAKTALERYSDRIKKLTNTISENELGQIIRKLDDDINWDFVDRKPLNDALVGIRTGIDGILKHQNQDYAQAMIPVAEGTRIVQKAKSLFHLQSEVGKGLSARNSTAAALKNSVNANSIDSREVLNAIHKWTGRNYLAEAEAARIASQFIGGTTQGAKRTLIGVATGTAIGNMFGLGVPGSVAGALAGGYADMKGGAIAGGLIDDLVKASQRVGRPVPSRTLQRAIGAAAASKYQSGK